MKANIKELGYDDFHEITQSDKPYVITFTNPTCHLCKALKPIVSDIAQQYQDKFKFGNINSRTQRKLFQLFGIDGVPEMFIVNGDDLYHITYPDDDPDPDSGYSKQYIIDHLKGYLDEHTG